jgi:hypothetical protein
MTTTISLRPAPVSSRHFTWGSSRLNSYLVGRDPVDFWTGSRDSDEALAKLGYVREDAWTESVSPAGRAWWSKVRKA